MAKILIKNGRIWDGNNFFFSDVLTDGKYISKVEPQILDSATYVFDASGKIVAPGLVDAHVHLRGISSEKYGIQAEIACFPFGATAAVDGGAMHGDRALLDSFMLKNLVFVAVDIKDNHADFTKAEKKLADYGDKAVGLKIYFDKDVPELRDITPLKETCCYARSRGLKVMVHATGQPVEMAELLAELAPGDILTHAFHGGTYTAADDDFKSMKEAQKRGVIIDAGFAGHIHTNFAVFRQALDCGVIPDVISTDITKSSAYTRGGRFGLTMCMSMARTAGMAETDIFRAVTSKPAEVMGKADQWGYLRAGAVADIAVLELAEDGFDLTDRVGNRLSDTHGYRCVLTVADGQIVYKD